MGLSGRVDRRNKRCAPGRRRGGVVGGEGGGGRGGDVRRGCKGGGRRSRGERAREEQLRARRPAHGLLLLLMHLHHGREAERAYSYSYSSCVCYMAFSSHFALMALPRLRAPHLRWCAAAHKYRGLQGRSGRRKTRSPGCRPCECRSGTA